MRFFNTEGPVRAEDHYCIPPLTRVDLDEVLALVRMQKYFVLHAPRQTGKTSALLALRDLLNGGAAGDHRCVYANFEVGQAAREDTARAMQAMLGELARRARLTLGDDTPDRLRTAALKTEGPDGALIDVLTRWAEADPRPLVLLIDEVDTLVGDTLLSVLRQLRAGYDQRPASFPHSVVLCGVRDVRDYRIRSGARNALVLGGSAFNIKSKSLRLGDFSEAETRALLGQHTAETGQAFTPAAVETVCTRTVGQPWLVNALCREACFESAPGRDRSHAVTEDDILDAQERLILARVTHLDNLADKLREERVRRVVGPMLIGADGRGSYADRDRDVEYARDLGLLARGDAKRIANPIYSEVIPRELTRAAQDDVEAETASYVDAVGGRNVDRLLEAFQRFFREHSEHWTQRFDQYREAGPQLLLQAYLQKVVNGGGRIEREYALGRGRVDLLIVWPHGGRDRRFVVECKVRRDGLERTIELRNPQDFDNRVGRDVLNAFCRCFVHVNRLNSMVSCMHTSQCHHGGDSVAYARDLETLAWFTVGTLRELAKAIRKLRSALAKRGLLDPESVPWLTLRKLEERWENDESYREMRNTVAFHLDEEAINRGLDDLTKDPCVPLANGQGSKHVKSRLTLGFLALHNGLGLDLDGYRRFHEAVMADLAAVPQAIQNAFIDAAKGVGVPFGDG